MIGILGGTFDPPHWGHLKLAQNFIEKLQLTKLILLPAGEPWQKSPDITPAQTRYQLTQAAASDLQNLINNNANVSIEVSRLELDRDGPSYAIDSAKSIRQTYGPNESIVWLMGLDSFNQISTWKDWEQLPNYLNIAVANRSNQSSNPIGSSKISPFPSQITSNAGDLYKSPHGKVFFDQDFYVDVSSTHIREGLRNNPSKLDLSETIPPKVLGFA